MSRQQKLEHQLRDILHPSYLHIDNESHSHALRGSETHFKIIAVSTQFTGMSLLKRHQFIYAHCADEFQNGLHALSLHLYTPEEWQQRTSIPQTPACHGGSKQ